MTNLFVAKIHKIFRANDGIPKNKSNKCEIKPSAHSTIFVAEEDEFCRWRRKLAVCGKQTSAISVADDENLLCAGNKHQRFLSLMTIFNIKHARNSFSSLTTEVKIFLAMQQKLCCVR